MNEQRAIALANADQPSFCRYKDCGNQFQAPDQEKLPDWAENYCSEKCVHWETLKQYAEQLKKMDIPGWSGIDLLESIEFLESEQ